MRDANSSRLQISHPYPPSYRLTSSPSPTPQPPSPSMLQRRRDQQPPQHPPIYDRPSPNTQGSMDVPGQSRSPAMVSFLASSPPRSPQSLAAQAYDHQPRRDERQMQQSPTYNSLFPLSERMDTPGQSRSPAMASFGVSSPYRAPQPLSSQFYNNQSRPDERQTRQSPISDHLSPQPGGNVSISGQARSPTMVSFVASPQSRSPQPLQQHSRLSSPKSFLSKTEKEGEYPEGWTNEDAEAERDFLSRGLINWDEMRRWRFWIRKEWTLYYVLGVVMTVVVIFMAVFHDQIVTWLTPAMNWMKNLPAGWVIPIVVLFVISFPPLFGHEIVAILVGVVWGLWIGFGIVAAGTLLGELGNYFAFKYLLRRRAEKHERENLNYACMAYVVRDGGFPIIFAARLSAIPGHFSTAVFSTCGVGLFIFTIACILSLPKQLVVVYLGVIFAQKDTSSKNKIISDSVLALGFVLTVGSAWWIYSKMNKARVPVWRQQRMAQRAERISMNAGPKRASYREYPTAGEDPDAMSPILLTHQPYREPYENQWHPDINADSVDDFEGQNQDRPLRPAAEAELGFGYNPSASTQSFPEAHPFATGVRREASKAAPEYSVGALPVEHADFPMARPVPPLSESFPGAHAPAAGVPRQSSKAAPEYAVGAMPVEHVNPPVANAALPLSSRNRQRTLDAGGYQHGNEQPDLGGEVVQPHDREFRLSGAETGDPSRRPREFVRRY